MRTTTVLSACATVALMACTSESGPTEPEARGVMAPAGSAPAAAVDIWRPRGPHRFGTVLGVSVGVATNSAGQSVVYGFGGCDVVESSGSHCTVSRISIYNVVTDTWTADHPAEQAAVWKANGVGTIGGKLYWSGGYNTHEEFEFLSPGAWAYDPAARRVTRLANMPKATAEGVTGVINGKLYVLPGKCEALGGPAHCEEEPIRRLYRYNPTTDRWAARKSAPHYHRSGAGGVIGGKFYVVGGFHGTQPVAALDVYDPATDTWRTRAPIPTAGGAIGTAVQGKLYVIVGVKAYVYDPGTNKWSPIAPPTREHEGAVRVVINGKPKLLAIGGLHGTGFELPNNTEVYTP